jgi:hypothetical protein
VVSAGHFRLIDSEIVMLGRSGRVWSVGFKALYIKPWMRFGPLLMGAIAAVVQRDARVRAALSGSGWLGTCGLVVAVVVAAVCGEWDFFSNTPRWMQVSYMATYHTVFGACWAYILLITISEHRVGKMLGRFLGARAWYPIAQLAYSAYLLNPLIADQTNSSLAPLFTSPAKIYFLAFPFELLLTLAGAAVIHVFVERPFMQLRPRGGREEAPAASSSRRGRPFVQIAAVVCLGALLPLALYFGVPPLVAALFPHP